MARPPPAVSFHDYSSHSHLHLWRLGVQRFPFDLSKPHNAKEPPRPSFAFTSAPADKCCFTASISPSKAASRIEMSGGCGPHPTSTTNAIVVIRRCFISIHYPSCRRVCGGGRRFLFDSTGWPNLAVFCRFHSSHLNLHHY